MCDQDHFEEDRLEYEALDGVPVPVIMTVTVNFPLKP